MWSSEGLECVIDITEEQKQLVWGELNGKKYKSGFNLEMLKLRARVNSQRHYEIYTFNSGDFELTDVENLFETDPQIIVNWIRAHGNKIYSDRVTDAVIV
jgi:hypothetical protein